MGYVELVRRYPDFRRVWISELVSFFGDWFNTIALYTAVERVSGSAEAVSAVFVAKMLPFFLVTPIAGPIVDRFDRRTVLIVSDIARAVCALGLVACVVAELLVPLIVLLMVMMAFAGVFVPARTAVIAQVTPPEHLAAANALSAGTWSTMLAFGAAMGGWVTEAVGVTWSLVLDAATFVLSALVLLGLPALPPERSRDGDEDVSFRAGLRYLRARPLLLATIGLKPGMALGNGTLAMLPLFAQRVLAPGQGATALGLLYAARGLGAMVGSLAVRRVVGDDPATMRRLVPFAFAVAAVAYGSLAVAPSLAHGAAAFVVGAVGSSTVWVFSQTLAQLGSDDAFRGRVFSMEFGLLTLVNAAVATVAGVLVERAGWPVPHVAGLSAAVLVVPALLWVGALWRHHRRAAP